MRVSMGPTGELVLKISSRDESDLILEQDGYQERERAIESDLLPPEYHFIEPWEVGALTDAPILRHENGSVWWFPNYCLEDWTETLAEKGEVTFTFGGEESDN